MAGCRTEELRWRMPAGDVEESPFWYMTLPSEEAVTDIGKRMLLTKVGMVVGLRKAPPTFKRSVLLICKNPRIMEQSFIPVPSEHLENGHGLCAASQAVLKSALEPYPSPPPCAAASCPSQHVHCPPAPQAAFHLVPLPTALQARCTSVSLGPRGSNIVQ